MIKLKYRVIPKMGESNPKRFPVIIDKHETAAEWALGIPPVLKSQEKASLFSLILYNANFTS
jgi:hypothetical protein